MGDVIMFLVVLLIIGIVSVPMGILVWGGFQDASEGADLTATATATVTDVRIVETSVPAPTGKPTWGTGHNYDVYVSYTFPNPENASIMLQGTDSRKFAWAFTAENYADAHPPASTITVQYDPADPYNHMLFRERHIAWSIFLSLFGIVMIGGLVYHVIIKEALRSGNGTGYIVFVVLATAVMLGIVYRIVSGALGK
ncbi:DUF3592 domain-containing protein [Candidatus Uhrbacteria bacterium]|nr:DUF3592 domain-containing protein [Candidatus Uhrbacteria bacterium]